MKELMALNEYLSLFRVERVIHLAEWLFSMGKKKKQNAKWTKF